MDQAYHSLETAIFTGKLRPGDRLIEQQLCNELEISRTTVREALLMLKRDGLVQGEARKGTFVTKLSPASARDFCTARVLIEGYAVHAGFNTYDSALFTALQQLTEAMSACELPGDVAKIMELDMAFHGLLVSQAKSPHLTQLWSSLNGQTRALYLYYVEQFGITTSERIVMIHEELVHDLASHDIARAERSLIAHYFMWNGTTTAPEEALPLLNLLARP